MKASDLIDFDTLTYKWDIIEKIPEFAKLKECKQNPKWHKEGDCWEHTKLVCKEAFLMGTDVDMISDLKLLLSAALFHDIGKGTTTFFKEKDQQWHAYGHEVESERITREMLSDEDPDFVNALCKLVRWHMAPLDIRKSNHKTEKIFELAKKVSPEKDGYHDNYKPSFLLLVMLKICDVRGSIQVDAAGKEKDIEWLYNLIKVIKLLGVSHCYPHLLDDL